MVAPLVMAGIGAGVGALGHWLGPKPQAPTETTMLDPASQAYVNNMRGNAQMWANRPMGDMDPSFLAAMHGMQGYADAGQMGVNAMTDPTAAMKFMNPFFGAMNPFFDQQRAQSLNQLRSTATAQGAFGNNRLGFAEGAAMNGINNTQAQFSYQGFQDAQQRALDLAHMGMGAHQWLGQQGQYLSDRQRNYDIGSLGMLRNGLGPTGSVWTGPKPQQHSLGQDIFGGAMAGLSMGGGPKAPGGFSYPDAGQGFGPATPGQGW